MLERAVLERNTLELCLPPAHNSPKTIDRRKRISKIQSDPSLNAKQKSRMMQCIMSETYHKAKQPEAGHDRFSCCGAPGTACTSDTVAGICPSVPSGNRQDGQKGCEHYSRNCAIKAECCGNFFACRLCHDEQSDHKIDRTQTKEMMCLFCNEVQPCAKECRKCGEDMGHYHCDKCNLWDNDKEKSIYHCDKCGLCRVGEGLGIDFYHCDKCNVCMSIKLKDNHPCIERNLESDCPICGEYMFTSTKNICFMRCGHCMHRECYQKHVLHSYQCPICSKSLWDMPKYFAYLDKLIGERPMPEEYCNTLANILCNDCQNKTTCTYHFIGHKCFQCRSYNTRLIETFTADDSEVEHYRKLSERLRSPELNDDPDMDLEEEDENVERSNLTAALSMNSMYSSCGSLSNYGSEYGSTQHLNNRDETEVV